MLRELHKWLNELGGDFDAFDKLLAALPSDDRVAKESLRHCFWSVKQYNIRVFSVQCGECGTICK